MIEKCPGCGAVCSSWGNLLSHAETSSISDCRTQVASLIIIRKAASVPMGMGRD